MKPVTSSRLGSICVSPAGWGRGGGRVAGNGVDQFGDAEVLERRSEIDGRQIAVPKGLEVEFGIAAARQLDLVCEAFGDRGGVAGAEELAARSFRAAHRLGGKVEQALELAAHADGPHLWADVERQHVGDLVQRLERIAPLAVNLVDEGDDRDRAQAADLEQLAGLRLDALAASITITAESTAVSVR